VGVAIRAVLIGAALALGACGDDDVDEPAPVRPHSDLLAPGEPLRLTFPTPYAIGDETRNGRRVRTRPKRAGGYDNYHVILRGPGGTDCRGRLDYALGHATEERRTEERTIVIRPRRLGLGGPRDKGPPLWCPGAYRGHVEYRQPEREPPIPFERLGEFAFSVR
jgi:hypothetical protein